MTFNPRFVLGDLDLTRYPFMVEFGTDLGNPENVSQVVDSMIADGEFVSSDRSSNRTLTIPVAIDNSDLLDAADSERALVFECDRQQNKLLINPGDGFGPSTVFRTFRTQLTFRRNDDEEQQGIRRYLLTIPALPFSYSTDVVRDIAVPTPPVSPSTVVISDGTSASGWSASVGSITSDGSRLVLTATQSPYNSSTATVKNFANDVTRTLSPAVDFTTTRYVSAEFRYELDAAVPVRRRAFVDGAELTMVSSTGLPDRTVRVTWSCDDPSATVLRFADEHTVGVAAGAETPTSRLLVDNVQRSNVGPSQSSTGRESLRMVSISGSARTAPSIRVEHATQALGDVIAYTSPMLDRSNSPDLKRWLSPTGITSTADTATVSGSVTTGASHVFDVPARLVQPGGYLLLARMRVTSPGAAGTTPVVSTVSTVIGNSTFGAPAPLSGDTVPTAWSILSLGYVTLPTVKVADTSGGLVRVAVSTAGYDVDEVWAFYMGDGAALTQVSCGSGTPTLGSAHNRLFIDSPTLDNGGVPAVFVGLQADRSDAFTPGFPSVVAMGDHTAAPPMVNAFIVTTGAANPTVAYEHTPAHFGNATQ